MRPSSWTEVWGATFAMGIHGGRTFFVCFFRFELKETRPTSLGFSLHHPTNTLDTAAFVNDLSKLHTFFQGGVGAVRTVLEVDTTTTSVCVRKP